MAKNTSPGREATDQPPPINAPFTRGQVLSLVIPGVLLLALIGVLLWGALSTVRAPAGAAPPPGTAGAGDAVTPTTAPAAAAAPSAATATPQATTTVSPPSATPAAPTETPAAPATATLAPTDPPATTPTAEGAATDAPAATSPSPPTAGNADRPLQGRRIGLDPGHGPRDDLGAVLVDKDTGKLILSEDELNLDVALRCRDILQARGATVIMTRETKDSFTAPWPDDVNGDGIKHGQADDLQERIDILNEGHAEVFLSIHANSSANPARRQGIQGLYCATDDCPFPRESKRLGLIVMDQLEAKLAEAGNPITQSELRSDLWSDGPNDPYKHLFLLGPAEPPSHPRSTHMPGLIIESLYVTSPTEAAQLKQDRVRQAIALAYADALQQYLTTPAP
jgi:N-acetylmuramoyl-L-alanine amidase